MIFDQDATQMIPPVKPIPNPPNPTAQAVLRTLAGVAIFLLAISLVGAWAWRTNKTTEAQLEMHRVEICADSGCIGETAGSRS